MQTRNTPATMIPWGSFVGSIAPRTVHHKFGCVLNFLEAQVVSKLMGVRNRPRFVNQQVQIYEVGQLHAPYHD
jgi:hypothetical protein